MHVGVLPTSDTTNRVYSTLTHISEITLVTNEPETQMREELNKGKLDGILSFTKNTDSSKAPVQMLLYKSKASAEGGAMAEMILTNVSAQTNLASIPGAKHVVELRSQEVTDKAFKKIDFILPGMLGFSLLSMGVFGTAFVFLNLRNTLVIKRFFATPIHKAYIVLGEALSRVIFALMSSSLIIVLGYLAFDFTLQHGIFTFFNIII